MSRGSVSPTSLVSGGAGFIAANLIPRLLAEGRSVLAADNLSRGRLEHVEAFRGDPSFEFVQADLADRGQCDDLFRRAGSRLDEVWHLAANSDIPAGVADPDVDLKDTFATSFEIIRAMRAHGVHTLHFASSSAIYGDHGEALLSEESGPLLPISNYGAMKLASEAQASAAAESHLGTVNLFRFPNVVGVPATHGVLLDFVRKLKANPDELEVLGDGNQQKAYLHVSDLVDAMLFVRAAPRAGKTLVINIGPIDDGVQVRWIAEQVVSQVSPGAEIRMGSGSKGWVGDVPRFRYSTAKLQTLGWRPRLDSPAAVRRALQEIAEQEDVTRRGGR
jgi:UDP-glucose 4-epimerase